ncbi:MAG: hypothetical protein GXZ02_08290 [Clostridiales bacterium]|nr:hypothetical protein [Clostridiales bacterium]
MTAYGDVVRYNSISNIGSGKFKPDGIYWDDALAGQARYSTRVLLPLKAVIICSETMRRS